MRTRADSRAWALWACCSAAMASRARNVAAARSRGVAAGPPKRAHERSTVNARPAAVDRVDTRTVEGVDERLAASDPLDHRRDQFGHHRLPGRLGDDGRRQRAAAAQRPGDRVAPVGDLVERWLGRSPPGPRPQPTTCDRRRRSGSASPASERPSWSPSGRRLPRRRHRRANGVEAHRSPRNARPAKDADTLAVDDERPRRRLTTSVDDLGDLADPATPAGSPLDVDDGVDAAPEVVANGAQRPRRGGLDDERLEPM